MKKIKVPPNQCEFCWQVCSTLIGTAGMREEQVATDMTKPADSTAARPLAVEPRVDTVATVVKQKATTFEKWKLAAKFVPLRGSVTRTGASDRSSI